MIDFPQMLADYAESVVTPDAAEDVLNDHLGKWPITKPKWEFFATVTNTLRDDDSVGWNDKLDLVATAERLYTAHRTVQIGER